MASFDLNAITSALSSPNNVPSGVDFTGKSLKLNTEKDAQPIVDAINACPHLEYLTLTGNTLGVEAAQTIARALERHPELKIARWSDMFTGRMKTEIPPALSALGDGMIAAKARLQVLDLSDNAFGPIGVEGLAKLLQSDVCQELQELRLNNNGLGITGGRLLARALGARLPRLRVFVAGRNRLENDGATALAAVFQKMGSLEEISMPQNGIYHVGVSALSEAFKQNPRLACLNLNDNTIGEKGAAAVAGALPRLKNLKSINFGDCLLKSKGALALARGIQDNAVLLESLDVSHNEVGRAACLQLVDAVTASPGAAARLARVVLAGNSLGGAANKKLMRDKLGDCAELSDGDASDDDDYVTDSDSEGSGSESESCASRADSEDSATEDAQHDSVADHQHSTLDTSGIEEVETDVDRFLQNPTADNFERLGGGVVDVIDAHLQSIQDTSKQIQAYVDATLCISGLAGDSGAAGSGGGGSKQRAAATRMFSVLLERAGQRPAASWLLANALLAALGLIKSENKEYKIRWELCACYSMLATVIEDASFPPALRDTLRFFARSKLDSLAPHIADTVRRHPVLYEDNKL